MHNSYKDGVLSRRQLLQAAGGVTLLALVPKICQPEDLRTVYELPSATDKQPVFTALPYLQPGPNSSKLAEGTESVVIAWQTDSVPSKFTVRYGQKGFDAEATISKASRLTGKKSDTEVHNNYWASLGGLKLGTRYRYQVSMDGQTLLEGFFTTRKPRGSKIRFVSFGDNSYGDISDRAIAFQAYRAMPDFVMNAGDNVYESGLDNEYARYFFPVYNADVAGPRIGAPLLRSVPFYSVIANHDVATKHPVSGPCADFTRTQDALGYFTNLFLPLNGPTPDKPTPIVGPDAVLDHFKAAAGDRFPNMANYSFDCGDAHFLCLDSNVYVDPTNAGLQAWIEKDLMETDALWKFVVYHHPAFNVGHEHYAEQQMRALSPIFEKHGVATVFSGHEHTYQRTKPLQFAPSDLEAAAEVGSGERLIPGKFTVDRSYDGANETTANGIIYITTGAGGKNLYDPDMNENPKAWLHEEDGNEEYVARMITDRHSITVVDVDRRVADFRQVDQWGNVIDRFRIKLL